MLNQAPYEWTIRELLNHAATGPRTKCPDGPYEPARPFGMFSLRSRFRLALMVFKGEADALRWPLQNPKAY
jgi:hypothetical protein